MRTLDHPNRHRDDLLALASRHRAIRVRIFGSALSGDDHAESDIDCWWNSHPRHRCSISSDSSRTPKRCWGGAWISSRLMG